MLDHFLLQIGEAKKMTKSTNRIKINAKKQKIISSNKSKSSHSKTIPTACNRIDQRHTKHIDETVREIRHLSGTDLISKSTTVFKELTSCSTLTKGSFENNKKNELDINLTPKVLKGKCL